MNINDDKTSPLDSDLLRTFLAVARRRNVTHAAGTLHRTQSAVSVRIGRLEKRLGTRLFRREARGVSLTESGERLRQAAERIVRELDRTALEFTRDPIGGIVSVGIPDDYGSDVLAGILGAFAAQHPSVDVSVRCEFGTEFPAAVEHGALDLAVCALESPPAGARTLFEEPTVWACARSFRIDSDQAVPLALFDRSCWWRDAAVEALRKTGRPYRIAYSSESTSGIRAALAAGLAVGVLSRSTIAPAMRVLGEHDEFPPLPPTRLSLLAHAKTPSPAVSAMADAIRRGFSKIAAAA